MKKLLFAMLLTLFPMVYAELCYQETANISLSCCGYSNGSYALNGSYTVGGGGYGALWDGNYSTWGNKTTTDFSLYVNYTKPPNSQGAIWQINRTNNQSMTLTTDPDWGCWTAHSNKLIFRINFTDTRTSYYCWYNTTPIAWVWASLGYDAAGSGAFWDEGIYWNFTTFGGNSWGNFTSIIGGPNQTLAKTEAIFWNNLTLAVNTECGYSASIINTFLNYNKTIFPAYGHSGTNYTANATPQVSGNYINRSYNWTTLINVSGILTNFTSSDGWIQSYTAALTQCLDGNQSVANFTITDSETGGNVYNGTANSTLIYFWNQYALDSKNYFKNLSNSHFVSFCMYPQWANFTVDIVTVLKNFPGYFDATYTGEYRVQNLDVKYPLSLFNNATAQQMLIYVVDSSNNPLIWVVVGIYRNGIYIGTITTDSEGKQVTYLEPYGDVYSFNVTSMGKSIMVPAFVVVCGSGQTCPPYVITLRFVEADLGDFFKYIYQTSAVCSVNSSSFLNCNVSDSSGTTRTFELLVKRKYPLNFTTICTNYCTNSPCTVSCDLGNTTNAYYEYIVSIYTTTKYNIYNGILDYTNALLDWGLNGVFLALFLVLILFFVGAYNPVAGITLIYFALIISQIIGILSFGWESLIGLGFVIGLIIYKLGI